MRARFVIFLAVAFFAQFAPAQNAITFSPGLPKPWTQLSSQVIPGTNPITHDSITANITVVQDKTNLTTMLISVIPAASAEATNHLVADARDWIHGVLDGFAENHDYSISRLAVKTEDKKRFAETAFTVRLQDATLFGISRYAIVGTNAIGWVAFGRSTAIESNKVVLGIAASVKIKK